MAIDASYGRPGLLFYMLSWELCLYDTRELIYRQSDEWIIHLPNISMFMIIILKPLEIYCQCLTVAAAGFDFSFLNSSNNPSTGDNKIIKTNLYTTLCCLHIPKAGGMVDCVRNFLVVAKENAICNNTLCINPQCLQKEVDRMQGTAIRQDKRQFYILPRLFV